MDHESIRIILAEHAALTATLQSLRQMVEQGPGDAPQNFFDVLRAMLFYIDEFPGRQHHNKESELLFPSVARRVPHLKEVIARMEHDHAYGEAAVRELLHLLLAWELLGETHRTTFVEAARHYVDFFLEHLRLEEQVIIPEAQNVLLEPDWQALDAAFATNSDPLTGRGPTDPMYDRLLQRILMKPPAPVGPGVSSGSA
ncbi:hemerythrin domain-containing protein [Polaromonas sp.]|uniref:hemerythrin domain-containing protein n=1 Tax=Polaromonas sp. TaxID=1869339 RepID=UPI00286B8E31|nr:hemerythrin domain-containing protein [Polaromonas sp.]